MSGIEILAISAIAGFGFRIGWISADTLDEFWKWVGAKITGGSYD